MRIFFFFCLIVIISCAGRKNSEPETTIPAKIVTPAPDTCELEKELIRSGLVNIRSLDPDIIVELKYSTPDNFLHTDIYGDLENAYLQPDVAEKLVAAEKALQKKDSSLTLLVYDAVRPLSVQQKMWELLQMPSAEKTKYVSNPAEGSIHNYGAAVDLTVTKINGKPLDMGTPFDFFGELAQPELEAKCITDGSLKPEQLANRKLLRSAMVQAGFRQLPTEWWHYNSCSRSEAKLKYQIVE